VAVPYLSRRPDKTPEEYFYRIVAAVDDTTLTYQPRRPENAPASLSKGGSAIFSTFEPFVVKTQDEDHPIGVYAYMSAPSFASATIDDSDPEFTSIIPAEQYLDNYVFFVDTTYLNSQARHRSIALGG
jgi:hypothetical protein